MATKKKASGKTAAKKTATKRKPPAKKRAVQKTAKPAKKPAAKKSATGRRPSTKSGATKTPAAKKPTAKQQARPAARKTDGLDPSRAWSLEELVPQLPSIDPDELERVRQTLIRAQGQSGLIELGADYTTEDILAATPAFTTGVLLMLRKRGRPVPGLAPALLTLLVREALELTRVNAAYEQQVRTVSSGISDRRRMLKIANSKALAARRGVARTLLHAIVPRDSPIRAGLERAAGKAITPAATVASTREVADRLEELRRDRDLALVLDSYEYTSAHVAHLRLLAMDVEHLAARGAALLPPQQTDQRALDRQDGLVLAIMRAIWAPLRDARDDGEDIQLPPLGPLERLFIYTGPADRDEVSPAEEPPQDDEGGEDLESFDGLDGLDPTERVTAP